jgi:hypothetical protein
MLKKAGFHEIHVFEESAPYEKGSAKVSSFTISGYKTIKEIQNRIIAGLPDK